HADLAPAPAPPPAPPPRAPAFNPFMGMGRDAGSFIGGLPLDLSGPDPFSIESPPPRASSRAAAPSPEPPVFPPSSPAPAFEPSFDPPPLEDLLPPPSTGELSAAVEPFSLPESPPPATATGPSNVTHD